MDYENVKYIGENLISATWLGQEITFCTFPGSRFDEINALGIIPAPYVPMPSFLAREFFALLTVDDFTGITAATRANAALGLLWVSLQAQGEAAIRTDSERFLAGWAGLKQALGDTRAAAIASALGIPDA